jgi:hypothetical protein
MSNFAWNRSAFLVFIVALVAPQAARPQFLHPRIIAKEATIRKVVIMPAKVQIVRQSMKGPEGMAEESELLSERVQKLLSEALATKNVTTMAGPVLSAEGDTQQKYTVADVQSRYDDLLPRIMKKRKDVKQGRFSLGDEVLNLNLDKSVDAIVFVRGEGQKLTKGKTAFNVLVGGAAAYLRLTIGIVDARTGDVLLYTDQETRGDPMSAEDKTLRKAIEKSLKKLPA